MRTSAISHELTAQPERVQTLHSQTVPVQTSDTECELFDKQWKEGVDYTDTIYFDLFDDIFQFGYRNASCPIMKWAQDADAEGCVGRENLKAYIESHRQELLDVLSSFTGPVHEGRVLWDLVKKIDSEGRMAEAFA